MSGSGTLVTIDGVRGILTAGHVVQNWRNSKPKDQHPKRIGIVPDRRASTLVEEPSEHFVSFVTNPGESETFGPDLAFVRIPSPSGFLSCLLAKKSFWDLTRSRVVNRTVFITRTSPMASCGLVAEKTVVAKSNTGLNQYIFLWTEPQPFEREAYDYYP